MVAADRRAEPRAGERVPYVIVYGLPGLPLIKLVRRYTDHECNLTCTRVIYSISTDQKMS